MEPTRTSVPLFMWALLAVLVSQNLVIPVMSTNFEDQRHYYSPSPRTGGTPRDPHRGPSHGTSPDGSTPSHRSGGSYNPTPSTPSTGGGGGSGGYYPSPPSSSSGGGGCSPSPPSSGNGSGGYHPSPPSSGSGSGYDPSPPSPGSGAGGGYYPSPPSSGIGGGTPPSTPTVTPTIPVVSPPSTPLFPDPNIPIIGTCNFWRTHPGLVWGLLGWWGTVGGVFGVAATPAYGTNLSLQQALANTRRDATGALYREGTASFLNSMINNKFPFTTREVKDSFIRALASNKAAAAQAELFKQANEGRLKPRT
ncbi:protodermal factor 1-like isoform X4 [Macadamia integrifolia]|uniref:protodermal factor 1-like isoform X4 n=1 Tax=Macadamia integrifolia TaxID=60698 RepID=UPI001C5001D3|nr:protodermal factor 1-like isoform X4 [Macadamia integrifolia]